MVVNAATAGLSALNALLGGTAGGATAAAGSGFGPAALISLGQGTSPVSPFDGLYGAIGQSILNRTSAASAPQNTKQQTEQRQTIKQAITLAEQGQVESARSMLSDLAKKSAGSALVAQAQGTVELAGGEYKKAEDFFRKAAYLDPASTAGQDADNARALQKDDKTAMDRAKRLLASNDTKEAGVKLLNVLARRSPKNVEVRMLLGDIAVKDRDVVQATLNYSRALGNASKGQLEQLEQKLAAFEKSTKDAFFVQNLRGRVALKLGKHEEALATLEAARKASGDRVEYRADEALAHVAIGRDRLERGDVQAALASFESAYSLDSVGAEVRLARADGFFARAEQRRSVSAYDDAIADYERAAREANRPGGEALRERIAQQAYSVGRTLEHRRELSGGEVGQEVVAFQAAYDIDPSNRNYRRKLAETRNRMGDEYQADSDYKSAAGAYFRAYELEKSNATYKANAINAYVAYGAEAQSDYKFDEAIGAFRSAYNIDRTNGDSRSKLAEAYNAAGLYYRELGDDERAAGYFAEALHLYPDNQGYQDNYDSVG